MVMGNSAAGDFVDHDFVVSGGIEHSRQICHHSDGGIDQSHEFRLQPIKCRGALIGARLGQIERNVQGQRLYLIAQTIVRRK